MILHRFTICWYMLISGKVLTSLSSCEASLCLFDNLPKIISIMLSIWHLTLKINTWNVWEPLGFEVNDLIYPDFFQTTHWHIYDLIPCWYLIGADYAHPGSTTAAHRIFNKNRPLPLTVQSKVWKKLLYPLTKLHVMYHEFQASADHLCLG